MRANRVSRGRTRYAVSDQRWNARRAVERRNAAAAAARTAVARLTRGLGGYRGKARALREACQLRGAVETQREAQALALPVHGPGAHAQHLRNLARAKAERHLAQDLPLAQGEVRRAVVEIPVVARRDPQAHLWSDRAIPAAGGDLLQRPQQLLAAVLLQHVAERPRVPHRTRDVARPRARQHENRHLR